MDASVGSAANNQPICTVVFEVVYLGRVTLVLRPQLVWSNDLRVVYDRIYAYSDASHSVTAFLESNYSFERQYIWHYADNTPTTFANNYGVPAYSIRILPTHDHRPPFPGLPAKVLRQIICEAIISTRKQVGWRSALLSYGTVCKSWVHVLDLFYTFYCRIPDPPTAVAVAKSLQYKPENATLIRRFDPHDYLEVGPKNFDIKDMKDDEYMRTCQALLDILELMTHIREIVIFPTEESLLPRQILCLRRLREITTCTITGVYRFVRVE